MLKLTQVVVILGASQKSGMDRSAVIRGDPHYGSGVLT